MNSISNVVGAIPGVRESTYVYATVVDYDPLTGLSTVDILGEEISGVPKLASVRFASSGDYAPVEQGALVATVRNAGSQTISTTTTELDLTVESYNPFGATLLSNQLIVPWAGIWRFQTQVTTSGGGTDRFFVALRKNQTGSSTTFFGWSECAGGSSGSKSQQCEGTETMNGTTDFVTVAALCNPSGSTTTSFGGSWLSAYWHGPELDDPWDVIGTNVVCIRDRQTPLTIVDVLQGSTV